MLRSTTPGSSTAGEKTREGPHNSQDFFSHAAEGGEGQRHTGAQPGQKVPMGSITNHQAPAPVPTVDPDLSLSPFSPHRAEDDDAGQRVIFYVSFMPEGAPKGSNNVQSLRRGLRGKYSLASLRQEVGVAPA